MSDYRTLKITVAVVGVHALLLYMLQSGLAHRVAEAVMVQPLIAELIAPEPQRQAPQPQPRPPKPEQKLPKPVQVMRPEPMPQPAPSPQPITQAMSQVAPLTPAVTAQAPSMESSSPGNASQNATPQAVSIGQVQCNTPDPAYPTMSRRLGEQGTVSVRLVIGESGTIDKAELSNSSGFVRLDQVALDAARNTRCKPYTENGRAMRVTAVRPFVFKLD